MSTADIALGGERSLLPLKQGLTGMNSVRKSLFMNIYSKIFVISRPTSTKTVAKMGKRMMNRVNK
jgi:hypothetical protein